MCGTYIFCRLISNFLCVQPDETNEFLRSSRIKGPDINIPPGLRDVYPVVVNVGSQMIVIAEVSRIRIYNRFGLFTATAKSHHCGYTSRT